MKISKSFAVGLSALVLLTACDIEKPYEGISGIDKNKARPMSVTLDEDNLSSTGISIYWDAAAAVEAGALSFTAQLVTEYGGAGDNYNSKVSVTIEATDEVGNYNDAATFNKLTKGDRYYVRVRANYGYSVWSDWEYLCKNGEPVMYSVGMGYVYGEFSAPNEFLAAARTYASIKTSWAVVGPADGYEVSYKESSASEWTLAGKPEQAGLTTETSFVVKGLVEETSYDVRVRAYRSVVVDEESGTKEIEWSEYSVASEIVTPFKPDFNPEISDEEQFQRFIEEIAAQSGTSDVFTLKNDIDLSGVEFSEFPEEFNGKFDGQGFKLKNLVLDGKSLFCSSEGEICNLVFDKSCQFSNPSGTWGALVAVNKGIVSNCVNNADVNFSAYGKDTEVGCLVGRTTGEVTDCVNNGNLLFKGSDVQANCSFGGVVGIMSGSEDQVLVSRCVNNGDIIFENTSQSMNIYIGGVIGGTPQTAFKSSAPKNYGTIADCENNGTVSLKWSVSANGSYCDVAGVAGYVEGSVLSCTNRGAVSIISPSNNAEASTRPAVAGVVAAVLYDLKGCVNEGKVYAEGCYAAGTAGNQGAMGTHQPCFAGVAGAVGTDNSKHPDIEGTIVGNTNKGVVETVAIQKSGAKTEYYAGGVIAYSHSPLEGCRNEGELKFAHASRKQRMGGVVGAAYKDITSCSNAGKLTFDAKAGETGRDFTGYSAHQNYIGGIVGMPMVTIKIKGCYNTGAIEFKNGWASAVLNYVGGINGSYNKSQTMEDCHNYGPITVTSSEGVCLCVGGISGAFNGVMTGCSSESDISVTTGTPAAGKEHEVGGLVGYTNADIYNCTVSGTVTNNVSGTYVGGLLGGFGANNRQLDGCTINTTVSGEATAGSILGQFRGDDPKKEPVVTTLYYSNIVISPACSGLPICGNLRNDYIVEGTIPAAE